MAKINSLFKMLQQQGASDLHISSGAPPMFILHLQLYLVNLKIFNQLFDIRGGNISNGRWILSNEFPSLFC